MVCRWYDFYNKNEVKSLGGENSMILSMSDGSAVISEVGQPLYLSMAIRRMVCLQRMTLLLLPEKTDRH